MSGGKVVFSGHARLAHRSAVLGKDLVIKALRMSGLCSENLLEEPAALDEVLWQPEELKGEEVQRSPNLPSRAQGLPQTFRVRGIEDDQPLHPLGMCVGQCIGDVATPVVAHDAGTGVTQCADQTCDVRHDLFNAIGLEALWFL